MATATAVVNGIHPAAQDPLDEVAEFAKIIKLRDQVFSGNHPRLTVPANLLRKLSPVSTQVSSHTPVPVLAQQQPSSQVPGLSVAPNHSADQSKQSPLPAPPQVAATVTGVNPILLTKSAEVVKAEANLLRNRLEKQLRDQFEQKRADFRKRPAPAEAKPDFDISTILAKALEVVKPVSLGKESDKEDDNESFDENSFYSSRAPDSTPERPEPSLSSHESEIQDHVDVEATITQVAKPFSSDLPPSSQSFVPQLASRQPIAAKTLADAQTNAEATNADMDDEDEEGEYSPPEVVDQSPAQNGTGNEHSSQMIPDPRSRHLRKYSDLDQNGKRPASPSQNMRIVRNHITSPFAPQPSRVSPLTLTKDSLVSQDRRYQDHTQRGRANSPSQSPEAFGPRNKKRKMNRKEEKRMKKVKREDVSPPPFHDIQPLGQTKVPQNEQQPIVIDDLPPPQDFRYVELPPPPPPPPVPQPPRYVDESGYPQEIRYMPAPRFVEAPPRPLSRQAEVIPMSEPRVLSRTSMRPREDQDLRRVASMHNMRGEQPREYIDTGTPLRQRAASHMRAESPMRAVPREYAVDTEHGIQEVRVVRTPAPEYREVYSPAQPEVRYIQESMPPPPRERIVVDQYGRRFREIVAEAPPVPSPVPRATSYMSREVPRYADTYVSSRAGSVMLEERSGPRYEQDMPPPPVLRQVGEAPAKTHAPAPRDMYGSASGARATGSQVYDSAPNSRPGTAQVYERPPAVVYADSQGEFRTPVRMSSVRPAPQYEEVMQVLPRAGSVRPLARESSIYMEDRGMARREYVPMEQPTQSRYRVVDSDPPAQVAPVLQPRYVDAHGREVMAVQQHDGEVRYIQRYQ